MKRPSVQDVVIALVLVALCVVMRLVPHAWNVTPVAATALFAGFLIRSRVLAFMTPIGAMFISDLLGPGFYGWTLMATVYVCLAAPALLGRWVRGPWMAARVIGASLAGSVLFFLVTNFMCFLSMSIYDKSMAGLIECYTLALPFFRNTVLGDLAWNCTLFGAWATAPVAWRMLRARARRVPA